MNRSIRLTLTALACAPVAALAQKPLALTKAEAEYAEPFTQIAGVRELKDGRVLVADVRDKTLQLIDFKAGSATKVGREGQGPGEYSLPMRLVALPGDSTAVFDGGNQRYLTIHPDGKAGKDFRLEAAASGGRGGRAGEAGRMMVMISPPRGVDARGNIYYEGPAFGINADGVPAAADTVAVIRFDRAARRADTVAFVHLAKGNANVSGGRGEMRVMIGQANPLIPRDDWVVLPDGKVAVVRASDYHIDFYGPARAKLAGPATPYEKIKVDDAVKKQVEADRARGQRNGVRMTMDVGGRGGNQRSTQLGGGGGDLQIPPLTDWPDFVPPFLANAAASRPNGEVWVLRTRKPGDNVPVYDVFDATGRVIGRVALPAKSRLAGFGQGTVYLIRLDDDDLQYLQRYRLPMDAKLNG
jgi:hypothetical protein